MVQHGLCVFQNRSALVFNVFFGRFEVFAVLKDFVLVVAGAVQVPQFHGQDFAHFALQFRLRPFNTYERQKLLALAGDNKGMHCIMKVLRIQTA